MTGQIELSFGLTEAQLADIRRLEAACNQFEGLTMKLNWSTLQDRPTDEVNDFLYYQNGRLLGYLALYAFNKKEVEISAMTQPDFRRKGIFSQLFEAARQELTQRKIPDCLFICERASEAGKQCLQAMGAVYEVSEYKMRLQAPVEPLPMPTGLQLRPAQLEDIADLARMDELCFGVPVEISRRWLEHDLGESTHQVTVAILEGIRIGKIMVYKGEPEAYIAGFCMKPEYRHRGYGKAILAQTVEQLVAEHPPEIVLEVACHNAGALSLYERCGFRTVTAYDYYRLPLRLAI